MNRALIMEDLASGSLAKHAEAFGSIYPHFPLTDIEFAWASRIFKWTDHALTFQDLMEECKAMRLILKKHESKVVSDSWVRRNVIALVQFMDAYIEEGKLTMDELQASTYLQLYVLEPLAKLFPEDEDLGAMRQFIAQMEKIEALKHKVYWLIRTIGDAHLAYIRDLLFHANYGNQGFILHALDSHYDNAEVKKIYQDFIEFTEEPELKKAAKKYLEAMS